MKITWKSKFAVLAALASITLVSPASAAGWGWDRDAGAKMRGEFGGTARARSSRSYAYTARSYGPNQTVPSVAAVPSSSFAYRSFSYEPSAPAAAAPFCPQVPLAIKAGEAIHVAADGARLMVGTQVVGTVARGQRLTVSEVQGPWLGTTVTMPDGQTVSGWILTGQVTPAR